MSKGERGQLVAIGLKSGPASRDPGSGPESGSGALSSYGMALWETFVLQGGQYLIAM